MDPVFPTRSISAIILATISLMTTRKLASILYHPPPNTPQLHGGLLDDRLKTVQACCDSSDQSTGGVWEVHETYPKGPTSSQYVWLWAVLGFSLMTRTHIQL